MSPKKTSTADFEPDIGGIFDDFDSPIIRARFGDPPEKYKAKADAIGIHVTFDQKFNPSDGSGERNVEQFYSIGSKDNWEIKDGGKEVINTKNPDKHAFNQNTSVWQLVEKMILHAGAGDMKKGLELFSKRDHWMTEAAFYTYLNYHWKLQKVLMYRGGTDTKEKQSVDMLLPDKFIGETKEAEGSEPAEASELDSKLLEFAHGKTEKEVKAASIKLFKGNSTYIKEIINGPKLKNFVDSGELFVGDDGKYM